MDLASYVLLRILQPDGSKPYTVVEQFTNTGGISVLLNNFKGHTEPLNEFLGNYIFLGMTPAANASNRNMQG